MVPRDLRCQRELRRSRAQYFLGRALEGSIVQRLNTLIPDLKQVRRRPKSTLAWFLRRSNQNLKKIKKNLRYYPPLSLPLYRKTKSKSAEFKGCAFMIFIEIVLLQEKTKESYFYREKTKERNIKDLAFIKSTFDSKILHLLNQHLTPTLI